MASKYRWNLQGAVHIPRRAGIPRSALYIGKSKEHQNKTKMDFPFFIILFFYRWCHPVGLLVKSTVVKQWPLHLVHSPFLLFRHHISPLGSILLLAQQRQVANFLPFNLHQFPCSRRTHTREEEPRLPWVNWGRGLAKRQRREVKVF